MKKLIIPAALLLIVTCAQPFITNKHQGTNSIATTIPSSPNENTRSFAPQFTALNIPDEMKQNFRVNPKASQVIVGKSGTMILIPDNAFEDANGNAVKGKVKMEIVEGIKNADIIKMNLGTMSDQGPLETGGMIYVNAFSENGDTLKLADGKKLDIEMPTDNKKPGMKLWNGIVQHDGSISWTNPQALKENLRPVPVSSLEEKKDVPVAKEPAMMPAEKKHWGGLMKVFGTERISYQKWDDKSQRWYDAKDGTTDDSNAVAIASADGKSVEIVNLADEKFENTNIATAEFRSRLPFLRQACDTRVMLCYINNPNRALWKSDEAVADTLNKTQCPLAELFHQFAKLKQGKVDPSDPNTVAALDAARETAIRNYSHNVHQASHTFDQQFPDYASYSFGMQKMGWANVDRLCSSNGKLMFFNVHIGGENNGARIQVTLIVPGRNLFINGYQRPNGDYSFTHGEYEQEASFPTGEEAFILAKSGKEKDLRFELKQITLGTNEFEFITLHPGTDEELNFALGNQPSPKKEESETIIDDWYTQALKSGDGCLCNRGREK
jgi:hypothetical protein